MTDLYGRTVGLLRDAYEVYRDSPSAQDWLGYHLDRIGQPLRIAVTGPAGSGKSTVVNAVVGEQVAPVTVAGRQVLTWYADGPHRQATVYTPDGSAEDVPFTRDLQGWQPDEVARVAVQWPARSLRYATLIDTPADADVRDEADAVLHFVRTVDGAELAGVRAAQDTPVARAAPVSTILVLARADEIGAGRVDALSSARLVARRFARRPAVRTLCQHVVAVAGLVGYAGRTLTEAEYAMIKELAGMPRADLDAMLLSTDRFLKALSLKTGGRALLDRYGIFGIRLATTLVRGGCDGPQKLSAELVRRSGLAELRESIGRDFTDRPQVLKARSALLALERLLTTQPRGGTRQVAAELERVVASAHEFRELRLLAALRTGRVALPAVLVAEAEHLLGGRGTGVPARLAIEHAVTDDELTAATGEALARWQRQAGNPVLSHQQRRAAQVVVRSCEGMLTQLAMPVR